MDPLPYLERLSLSVNAPFEKITLVVMKSNGGLSATLMELGKNMKDYYQGCKTLFCPEVSYACELQQFLSVQAIFGDEANVAYSKTIQEKMATLNMGQQCLGDQQGIKWPKIWQNVKFDCQSYEGSGRNGCCNKCFCIDSLCRR